VHAVRARQAFDGERFLAGGATVLVEGRRIVAVEPFGHDVPDGVETRSFEGTLTPGLIDTHVHLVTDSGPMALDRVAGYSEAEIDAVVTEALARHLAAGVTTVRDLGDRRFTVVGRRDAQDGAREPRIVAAGPPITVPRGHCHYLGGEVRGEQEIRAAVRERVERRVDVVKVMASGGMNTEGTDVTRPQFSDALLRLLVDEAHAAGLPVAAHAHAASAIRQVVQAGVETVEHASFLVTPTTPGGPATHADDEDLERLASSGIRVCPTYGGFDVETLAQAPPHMLATMRELGVTPETLVADRADLTERMWRAGVRFVSGADAGITPSKGHGRYAEAVIELGSVIPADAALASATSVAADVCGLAERTGRLRPGYDADLAVFDGDLAHDLTVLRRVSLVVLRGAPTP
jgi:imidazolonepropionase-like amidohydrolase